MDSFNELLYKLRDVHERELEGWQLRVQELSNKKGCDIKRMEELFNRNQQMKEQQRILTENIKTLENRLRAGLCDRCTVTQEVAKRRQQEYESSQIQSLHQFSILVGEMNNLKKENRRLREELVNQRKALESQSNHLSNIAATEVKPSRTPDRSISAVFLTTPTVSSTAKPPEGGGVAVKTEADQKFEDTQVGASSRKHFESYKPLAVDQPPPPEESPAGDKRLQGAEGQPSPTSDPPQHPVFLKNVPVPLSSSSSSSFSSSAGGGEGAPSRHVLHAPMPCRPRPIKSGPLSFPWSVSVRGPGAQLPPLKPNPSLHADPRPAGLQAGAPGPPGAPAKQSAPSEPPAQRPPRLFRVRSLSELGDSQAIALERREMAPIQWRSPGAARPQRGDGGEEAEGHDGPLDLSERGRCTDGTPSERWAVSQGPEGAGRTDSPPQGPPPSSAAPPSPPSRDGCNYMEEEQREEDRTQVDQTEPAPLQLSSSMQPVVLLGVLHPALQKQGTAFSNGKLKPEAPVSSSDQQEREGGAGGDHSPASKRTGPPTNQHHSRESDTEDLKSHKRLKIGVGFED